MKRALSVKHIKIALFALIATFILALSLTLTIGPNINLAKAEPASSSQETEFEVTVNSVLAMGLTTCDSSNNSVVELDIIPSTAGTFKSNCQTVDIDTNAPGYTLSIRHNNEPAIAPGSQDYNVCGTNTFTAPYDGVYKLEAWGGGSGKAGRGSGGYSSGEITLGTGDVIYAYVGCKGQTAGNVPTLSYVFNGGAYHHSYSGGDSGGGGGATDFRLTNGDWDNLSSLQSRILVAGGGGGGYSLSAIQHGNQNGTMNGGQNGTWDASNCVSGSGRGDFGKGGAKNNSDDYGGGGGGWYGGCSWSDSGAGGGSPYVFNATSDKSGYSGNVPDSRFYISNSTIITGNEPMPDPSLLGDSMTNGKQDNGYARISWSGDNFAPLVYQNPTTISPKPNILSTMNSLVLPNILTNDTWGFAAENRLNFQSSYAIDDANNTYSALPPTDTAIYSTTTFPLPETDHSFYYAARLTPATITGSYATTITYTAVGEVAPEPVLTFKKLSSSNLHNCAIASDNNAYCWGRNEYGGGLGDGTVIGSNIPIAVYREGALEGKTVKQISAGDAGSCVIASDDNVYCWGGYTDNLTPEPVPKLAGGLANLTVKEVVSSGTHVCVIASDDNVYCWGWNGSGALGNGSESEEVYYNPVPVSKLAGGLEGLTVKQIAVGDYSTCVIASDNNAYCWGGNTGNDTTGYSNIPVPVSKLTGGLEGLTVKQISTSGSVSCVIASDDNAYCWSDNSHGSLGNGTDDYGSTPYLPVPVKTDGYLLGKTIKQISTGASYVCVVASDDNAYCWGNNYHGTLGDGLSNNDSNVPIPVSKVDGGLTGLTIKQVSATGWAAESSHTHTCALASDNNIYCWGSNTDGVLGNGLNESSNIPIKVTNPMR